MKKILPIFLINIFSLAAVAQNITQLEYFIDVDAGFGKNTLVNVTPSPNGSFPFTVNLSGVSIGYHKLYMRTKDSAGNWSLTARRNIEVLHAEAKNNIESGEYFIDADPGFGAANAITISTPDTAVLQKFTAVLAGLSPGYHKLYARFKDSYGNWSLTFRRNIEVYVSDTNYVMQAEYFFSEDKGYGNCATTILTTPAVDGTFSFNIPLNEIPVGADTLFIRVKDSSENKWSLTSFKNAGGSLPLTLLDFTVTKQNDNAQLHWKTTNEINTSHFNIQRSINAINFETAGKVNALGNSNKQNDYLFNDNIAHITAKKIYYRLQILDKDGKLNYSAVKAVDNVKEFKVSVNPNPLNGNMINLSVVNAKSALLNISIYDAKGTKLYTAQMRTNDGNFTARITVNNFAPGIYFMQVADGSTIQSVKLLKQ